MRRDVADILAAIEQRSPATVARIVDKLSGRTDRRTAADALATVRAVRTKTRRRMTRLVVRCRKNAAVVTVYEASGRLLVELARDVATHAATTTMGHLPERAGRVADMDNFVPHPPAWLDTAAGREWTVRCGCCRQSHQVCADLVAAKVPERGTRTVGVADVNPPTVCL